MMPILQNGLRVDGLSGGESVDAKRTAPPASRRPEHRGSRFRSRSRARPRRYSAAFGAGFEADEPDCHLIQTERTDRCREETRSRRAHRVRTLAADHARDQSAREAERRRAASSRCWTATRTRCSSSVRSRRPAPARRASPAGEHQQVLRSASTSNALVARPDIVLRIRPLDVVANGALDRRRPP